MNYAQIRSMDVSNGSDIGVSLFVQGCHFHCKNCFNKSTWDFNGGKEYTEQTMEHILDLLNRPYIKRFTLLGGEPLAPENIEMSKEILKRVRNEYPDIEIWLFTGYEKDNIIDKSVLIYADVLVDGQYKDEQRDLSLAFRGSKNQNIYKKENCNWTKVA